MEKVFYPLFTDRAHLYYEETRYFQPSILKNFLVPIFSIVRRMKVYSTIKPPEDLNAGVLFGKSSILNIPHQTCKNTN